MIFRFKQFEVKHQRSLLKVGTDAVLLGASIMADQDIRTALDIGTGCGIIALMVAQRFDGVQIDAIEPDLGSYEEATLNFGSSKYIQRLHAVKATIQEFSIENKRKYDLIFSNPPFFKVPDFKKGNNPIDISSGRKYAATQFTLDFDSLIRGAASLLNENGTFWVILPYSEKTKFVEQAAKKRLFLSRQALIRSKPGTSFIRCILEFNKSGNGSIKEDEITLYTKDGSRHEEYALLAKDFYL